jgi:hypothetical protein
VSEEGVKELQNSEFRSQESGVRSQNSGAIIWNDVLTEGAIVLVISQIVPRE